MCRSAHAAPRPSAGRCDTSPRNRMRRSLLLLAVVLAATAQAPSGRALLFAEDDTDRVTAPLPPPEGPLVEAAGVATSRTAVTVG